MAAAGLTGIAYNPELTGREIGSIMDLLDPEFKGKVACLSEMRDTIGLFMMGLGHDPSVLDEDAIHEALDVIEEATQKGQFVAFTGNEYLDSDYVEGAVSSDLLLDMRPVEGTPNAYKARFDFQVALPAQLKAAQ